MSIYRTERIVRDQVSMAGVVDYKKGYVDLPVINQMVDVRGFMDPAARVVCAMGKELGWKPKAALGIPESGVLFGGSLAREYGIPLIPIRKIVDLSGGNLTEDEVLEAFVPRSCRETAKTEVTTSFTTKCISNNRFVINFTYINGIDEVILGDEFMDSGNALCTVGERLMKAGIKVRGAVGVSKLFCEGVNRARKLFGEDSFVSAVGIESISEPNDKKPARVILSPAHFQRFNFKNLFR